MEKRELTCIGCPLGCSITVTMENAEILDVTGNTCKRGDAYARKEVTHPTRIVTSTVRVSGGTIPMVSCKTKYPKRKDFCNYQCSLWHHCSCTGLYRRYSGSGRCRHRRGYCCHKKCSCKIIISLLSNDSHHSDKYLFQGNNCFSAPVSD